MGHKLGSMGRHDRNAKSHIIAFDITLLVGPHDATFRGRQVSARFLLWIEGMLFGFWASGLHPRGKTNGLTVHRGG